MEVVARRERLDGEEPRIVDPASQHEMTIQAAPARRDLRERHPHVEGDAGLLRQDSDGAALLQRGEERFEERPDLGGSALEVAVEVMAATGVRLIAVRERAPAERAGPQGLSRATWTAHRSPVFDPRGRGIHRGVVRRYAR